MNGKVAFGIAVVLLASCEAPGFGVVVRNDSAAEVIVTFQSAEWSPQFVVPERAERMTFGGRGNPTALIRVYSPECGLLHEATVSRISKVPVLVSTVGQVSVQPVDSLAQHDTTYLPPLDEPRCP